ncbi:MAG: RNB domain-containing ribonuclease, partial [Planctomycetes bacterium]|nr:RNB domain-containing ribonuclease [Planctomycetota bacterium]
MKGWFSEKNLKSRIPNPEEISKSNSRPSPSESPGITHVAPESALPPSPPLLLASSSTESPERDRRETPSPLPFPGGKGSEDPRFPPSGPAPGVGGEAGAPPAPPGSEPFLDLLADLAVFREESRKAGEALDLLREIGVREASPAAAFDALLACGHFRPDQNLALERSGYPARFDARLEATPPPVFARDPGRPDLRALPAFSIDEASTRDQDDAFAVERRGDGSLDVWVLVADVASAVAPGTPLDREALRRGCSLYMPEKTLGMLPRSWSE